MSVMELNQQDRGFSTLHREEVVRRVVRRIASVLDLDDFNDRLDLSGVPDSPAWEQDVLTVGCRQLGVYVKHLDSLTDEQALDVVREGHVVVILHKDGEYSIIERQLGRNVEITTSVIPLEASRFAFTQQPTLFDQFIDDSSHKSWLLVGKSTLDDGQVETPGRRQRIGDGLVAFEPRFTCFGLGDVHPGRYGVMGL